MFGFIGWLVISFIIVFFGRKYERQIVEGAMEEGSDISWMFSTSALIWAFGVSVVVVGLVTIGGALGIITGTFAATSVVKRGQ